MSNIMKIVRAEMDNGGVVRGPAVALQIELKPERLNVQIGINDILYGRRYDLSDSYAHTYVANQAIRREAIETAIRQMVSHFEKELRFALEQEAARKNPRSLYDAF